MNTNGALVLFSGGQDSTTCLAWTLARFGHVETVGFNYGQRHRAEIMARDRILAAMRHLAQEWGQRLGQDHMLELGVLKDIGGSALMDATKIEIGKDGLPTTFVPGRNVMFLTAAAALGYRRGIADLVGGMCETDFSGYPDCRDKTIKAVAEMLTLALARRVTIHTPLMWMDKAETWCMAERLGGTALVDLIREETVTCYEGDRTHHHDWGYGCGVCPACDLRANGYAKYIDR
jgi:7-cyano-7-deazaguanine synthase